MTNEIILAIVSAVLGGAITLVTSLILDWRKEKREEQIEARRERKEIIQKRPEMSIIEYKDYLAREGYGIKQKCDIELFVAKIEKVTTTGKRKRDLVYAHYRAEDFNPKEWCCVIYTFKNAGKTDISLLNIICNYKRDTCIFAVDSAKNFAMANVLNYNYCYDKKIRVGETITVKFCYHKDCVITGIISAIMSIGMEDDNCRYWTQPLFAPMDKVYDSRQISYKEYREEIRIDTAEECFKKPWLW